MHYEDTLYGPVELPAAVTGLLHTVPIQRLRGINSAARSRHRDEAAARGPGDSAWRASGTLIRPAGGPRESIKSPRAAPF